MSVPETAIRVTGVSKTFRIYRSRETTLKAALTGAAAGASVVCDTGC